MPQLPGFARQNDENGLRDFLGMMRIADLPQRDRIDQIDVPRHQRGKRFVGIIFRISPQQRAVVRGLHLGISVRCEAKTDKSFAQRMDKHRPGCLASKKCNCLGTAFLYPALIPRILED